jgi:hypothetical protein
VDWFSGSRFEICLLKALLWHGVLGVVAAFLFWLIEYVNRKLGVQGLLFFSLGDAAIVITFAVLTSISLVLRCLIVEITYYGIRRRYLMTGRLIREFVSDLAVFLVVAMATTLVAVVASLIVPFSLSLFQWGLMMMFQWGSMALAAVILGVAIQRRVWADRLEMYRDELVRQAGAEARGERA